MTNMKVIRVKAKVASKPAELEKAEALCKMYREELAKIANEAKANEKDRMIKIAHLQTTLNAQVAKIDLLSAQLGEAKAEILEWEKTCRELASRLCVAMDEKRAAESEAADLNIELMEREERIAILERRIKWLEAEAGKSSTVVS